MLQFKVLASGSKGNCYVVDDGNTQIILEAGIKFADVQKALNFQTTKIRAVLVTHEHGDHAKYVNNFLERGKHVYMSQGTKEALGLNHYAVHTVEMRKAFRIGSMQIVPFETEHDVAQATGFIIVSDCGQNLFFMTDSYYCRFNVKQLGLPIHIWAVECNYDKSSLDESVANGLHPAQKKRVMQSHMGLHTLIDFFAVNDLSHCEKIYLLHLSDRNANRETIFREIGKLTGCALEVV